MQEHKDSTADNDSAQENKDKSAQDLLRESIINELKNGYFSTKIDVQDHGIVNGIINIEKEPFENFISADEAQKEADAKIEELDAEINNILKERADSLHQRSDIEKELLVQQNVLADVKAKKTYHDNKLVNTNTILEEKKKRRASLPIPYSWLPALLFVLAGFTFILADVTITHDVVSYGMNMGGTEGWIFAYALAFIAILLKPAYDRIFEKPYQNNERRKETHILLVSVATLAVASLFVLGYFRSDADKVKNQLKRYDNQIETLTEEYQNENDSNKKRTIDGKIDNIERKKDIEVSKLADNSWRLAGFIFSGILFAFAGTICLSLGFPAVENLNRSFNLKRQILKYEKEMDALKLNISEIEAEISKTFNIIENKNTELTKYPDGNYFNNKIESIRTELKKAKEQAVQNKAKKLLALHLDAYLRGQIVSMDGDMRVAAYEIQKLLQIPYLRQATSTSTRNNGSIGNLRSRTTYTNERRRPFIKIREIITQEQTKYNNGQSTDENMEINFN